MKILGTEINGGDAVRAPWDFGVISADANGTLQGLGVLDLGPAAGRCGLGGWRYRAGRRPGTPRHTYRFALSQRHIDVDPPADARCWLRR